MTPQLSCAIIAIPLYPEKKKEDYGRQDQEFIQV